jgi:hypothetical protein
MSSSATASVGAVGLELDATWLEDGKVAVWADPAGDPTANTINEAVNKKRNCFMVDEMKGATNKGGQNPYAPRKVRIGWSS